MPRNTRLKVNLKRAYEAPSRSDGQRILVDRVWPRGVRKADLELTEWLRDVAPSKELRQWFDHDPARWVEFRRRYFAELDARPDAWWGLLDAARRGEVTLLFAARDLDHNNAVALKEYLEGKLHQEAKSS